ncbi:50S ribosomal protein L23 [Marispirochaeta aestuarii]|uniref:50S ribosomal protein L23 n=1 Tax=Marispirochaeta aestuarii TaxID=1963862 RepID=UPI0029C8A5EA|nr:50S ribosomal protein L23 [Marispirochaeta aestuarii]
MDTQQIIIEPVLTEKTNLMREGDQKKYVFKVHPWANKNMVMRAMKELFDVKPVKCNIVNVKAKPRSTRTKHGVRHGSTTPWKKAIVTLASGDKIEIIDGI